MVCCQKAVKLKCLLVVVSRMCSYQIKCVIQQSWRLARIPMLGARAIVCVDDPANVASSLPTTEAGTQIECLVEIDCGAGRCGVTTTQEVVDIAVAIDKADGLKFAGIQAYQGAMQHLDLYSERQEKVQVAIGMVKQAVEALSGRGLECDIVGGGGTGSYYFEGASGVYNELQCGSYAFMDADYGRILDEKGQRIDQGEWENALFILTSVMSHAKADKAICDAGLKAQSVDSGLPVIYGRDDVKYVKCSDEHGVIEDKEGVLRVNDKLRLVPGHCDPTCNVPTGMSGFAMVWSRWYGQCRRVGRLISVLLTHVSRPGRSYANSYRAANR